MKCPEPKAKDRGKDHVDPKEFRQVERESTQLAITEAVEVQALGMESIDHPAYEVVTPSLDMNGSTNMPWRHSEY